MPTMLEPKIVYESADFIAVNKPAGLQVHAARVAAKHRREGVEEKTLADWFVEKYPEAKTVGDDPTMRPGIVHRLDKETSGIILLMRTQAAFEYFKMFFQNHEIKKTYLALVAGDVFPQSGVIDKPIGIKNGTLKRSVHATKMLKEAITEYKSLRTVDVDAGHGKKKIFSLLEVSPKTGRTHQIRVHLASIGHPIAGDKVYGKEKGSAPRLMLHALSLEFTAPNGKRMRLEAEAPAEFPRA